MLKAIHVQESKKAVREKAKAVVVQLKEIKLKEAAKKVEDSVEKTLTYCDFPYEHWTRLRTNNVIERLHREIAAEPVWREPSRTATLPSCWFAPGCVMWPVPSGQQNVHEHEALRGGYGRRLYCRLTSFSQSLQTNLRITLDLLTKWHTNPFYGSRAAFFRKPFIKS